MSNRRPPTEETVKAAEQRVRGFLRDLARQSVEQKRVRDMDSAVFKQNRPPEIKGMEAEKYWEAYSQAYWEATLLAHKASSDLDASIRPESGTDLSGGGSDRLDACFNTDPFSVEAAAIFYEIGFWYPHGRLVALQRFFESSEAERLKVLEKLLAQSAIHQAIYDATLDLKREIDATNRMVKSPRLSSLLIDFDNVIRPERKRGRSVDDNARRNALLLNLVHIVTSEFDVSTEQNAATDGENDAFGIVSRVLNQEFRGLNMTWKTIQKVWSKHQVQVKKMAKEAHEQALLDNGNPTVEI